MPAPPRKTTVANGVTHTVQTPDIPAEDPVSPESGAGVNGKPAWLDNTAATRTSASTPRGQGSRLPPRKPVVDDTPITGEQFMLSEEDDDISDLIGGDDDFDVQLAIPEPGEQVLHSFLCVGGPWGSAMYTVANKSRGDIPVTVYGAKGFYRFEKDPERGTVLKWNLYPNVTDAEARKHYGLSHYE